jgi:site-specific DNA-cytosine methylase
MNYTHATIVPLIGGMPLAQSNVLKKRPEYILSYSAFKANDSQLLNYYNNEVPYILLDEGGIAPFSVDIVTATCPCAGLSTLSPSSSSNNPTNDWMVKSAKYVLEHVKPKCLWGENAPALATNAGKPVVARLNEIAKANGYVLSLYQTKSLLHGLSQVRNRSFYFFWKGNKIPKFSWFNRENEKIEDAIRNVVLSDDDPMNVLVRKDKPTENPFYRYVLEVFHEGKLNHSEFQNSLTKTTNPMSYLEDNGVTYREIGEWMTAQGFEKLSLRCETIHQKLSEGQNIMRKIVEIPKDYIGAFVGHLPHYLAHPDEDRYLTYRECLSIMKMPHDFVLVNAKKNLNMVCQNVPVTTAEDMAREVVFALDGNRPQDSYEWFNQNNKN